MAETIEQEGLKVDKVYLDRFNELTEKKNQVTFELGKNATIQIQLNFEKQQLDSNFMELLKEEQTVKQELNEKYGDVSINLQDGTITKM